MPITPPAPPQVYPSIEDVMNLARAYLMDTLGGGSGINFTDSSPEALPLLNAAMAHFQRDLWNRSVPTMVREIIIPSLPPINSALGPCAPNPAVYQTLGYAGFNDGQEPYEDIRLPQDLLIPIKIWWRPSGTNLTFSELAEAGNGLASFYQSGNPGDWEWQTDVIALNGATQTVDLKIRYLATVNFYPSTTEPAAFKTTFIPFRDSVQALAYRVAYDFAAARSGGQPNADLLASYQACVDGIAARNVRRMQHMHFERQPYGTEGDVFGWFG